MKAATTLLILIAFLASPTILQRTEPDWSAIEAETLQHFQTLLRFDSSDPPGNEQPVAEYLKQVLEKEGIPVEVIARAEHRPNVIARVKGNGSRRPILLMGHTDVVNVDPAKWTHPPFGAVRDGGHIYARGTLDDKDNLTASLMVMLMLKRLNVPLGRDVIFLAEAGEEGSTQFGIEHVIAERFDAVDAEYCLAEGGNARRLGGQIQYVGVQTTEKIPRRLDLTATGAAGHASMPLETNALVHLASAIEKIARWEAPIRLNETTATYFRRLAEISPPDAAARYRSVLVPERVAEVDRYFRREDPRHFALLHTTATPTIADAGYRINVIPSEAKASVDVRTLPDDDPAEILELVRKTIGDPSVRVEWGPRNVRPRGLSRLDSDAFEEIGVAATRNYGAVAIPTMGTGGTDMAYLRARGVQCYGIGPAIDEEDGPKGFGGHSDQERILEGELHRFVRFTWDIVTSLGATR